MRIGGLRIRFCAATPTPRLSMPRSIEVFVFWGIPSISSRFAFTSQNSALSKGAKLLNLIWKTAVRPSPSRWVVPACLPAFRPPACPPACLRARVPACLRACVPACLRACVPASLHACMHACLRFCTFSRPGNHRLQDLHPRPRHWCAAPPRHLAKQGAEVAHSATASPNAFSG